MVKHIPQKTSYCKSEMLRHFVIGSLYLRRELLCNLRDVRVSRGTFSKRHHDKLLKKLLLLKLDQVPL